MSLTTEYVAQMFAPLENKNGTGAAEFFAKYVDEHVDWTFGSPGATHMFAGRYKGIAEFLQATSGKMAAIFKVGDPCATSSLISADGTSAAVQIRSVGETKNGQILDESALWLVKAKDGYLVEIIFIHRLGQTYGAR
ncbi:hypothetical protein T439DRAFT_358897 [Meredithblackwellia eburnea MCA 4105]